MTGIAPQAPAEPSDDETDISDWVAADLHHAEVQLTRAELVWHARLFGVALIAGLVGLFLRPLFGLVLLLAAGLAVPVVRLAIQLKRLRRGDPVETSRRAWRAEVEEAGRHAEHAQRSAAVTPAATMAIVAITIAVTAIQIFVTGIRESIPAAALVKPAVRAGEWWRLISVAFLHGSLLHLLMNMSALEVFGSLIETYDERLRLPLVYLAAIVAGSVASTLVTNTSAVGASGGVLGLAGFVVVSSGLRPDGAPAWIRKQVRSSLWATAALGLVAFLFVDNAAHVGGAVAGMAVGWMSAKAPSRLRLALDVAGWGSAAILLAAALFTAARLLR